MKIELTQQQLIDELFRVPGVLARGDAGFLWIHSGGMVIVLPDNLSNALIEYVMHNKMESTSGFLVPNGIMPTEFQS